MARQKKWRPEPGVLAKYVGRYSSLLHGGRTVRVIAEASGQRMMVEAIGHKGHPVRFPVKTINLGQLPPGLFDNL